MTKMTITTFLGDIRIASYMHPCQLALELNKLIQEAKSEHTDEFFRGLTVEVEMEDGEDPMLILSSSRPETDEEEREREAAHKRLVEAEQPHLKQLRDGTREQVRKHMETQREILKRRLDAIDMETQREILKRRLDAIDKALGDDADPDPALV